MVRLVLDTNCIIDLEEQQRPNRPYVETIVSTWRQGRIKLAVVAISASENQRGGRLNDTYEQFLEKIAGAGLHGVTQLLPPLFFDVTYWDAFVFADDDVGLDERLMEILFPGVSIEAPTGEKELRAWRNRLCDVYVAWACIYHKWGTLVTNDANFHEKKAELEKLGLEVVSPKDGAGLCMP